MRGRPHKLMQIVTQTKLDGKYMDENKNPLDVFREAEKDDNIFRFGQKIHFCCYKTKLDEEEGILLLFLLKLPSGIHTSASSEFVMDTVSLLEKVLSPINEYHYFSDLDGVSKNTTILKITKKLKEFNFEV